MQVHIPAILHGRRLGIDAWARKALSLDGLKPGNTVMEILQIISYDSPRPARIRGHINDMTVLALHGLEPGFNGKFAELIYGEHDSDGRSVIVAEAASDLLTITANTLRLAPLFALYRPDWLSLGAVELLASKQKPDDISLFNWLSKLHYALGLQLSAALSKANARRRLPLRLARPTRRCLRQFTLQRSYRSRPRSRTFHGE